MDDDSLIPDLNVIVCCVAMCFDTADVIGVGQGRLPVLVGAIGEEESPVLELPLCANHAHLLRMGIEQFSLRID